ncbi:hypothetical protein TWF694_001970 [Orbilia ellipsospora]|uniref:Uncharacterized protein n=1 Tax=Orbilia ellipsospora TaxID=2528407 RepID=A0AAV9X483_9PEZI
MKSISLWTAVSSVLLFSQVHAFGNRGAIERVLYWYSYVAETEQFASNPATAAYTIAPGCVGSRAGGRCNLYELLSYLWHPEPLQDPIIDRPTPADLQAEFESGKSPLDPTNEHNWPPRDIYTKINQYKINQISNPPGKKPNAIINLTRSVDANRLFTGSSGFYEALSRAGGPINTLDADNKALLNAHEPVSQYRLDIVSRGQTSADLGRFLRSSDFEKYRFPVPTAKNPDPESLEKAVRALMGDDTIRVRTRLIPTVPDTGKFGFQTFQSLDVDATVNNYAGDQARLRTALTEAHVNFMADVIDPVSGARTTSTYNLHVNALNSAETALAGARGCAVSSLIRLEKRSKLLSSFDMKRSHFEEIRDNLTSFVYVH